VTDLEEQRQFLLDSLRDLEHEHDQGDIADEDYQRLRDDYTARAAAVLRSIESATLTPAGSAGAATPEADHRDPQDTVAAERHDDDQPVAEPAPRTNGPRRRALLTVAVVLVIALLAGVGVAVFSGSGVSGSGVTINTGSPAERLAKAHQLDSQGKAADAIKYYDSVLKSEPANAEALTYKGWLLARAGLSDLALQSLDKAIAVNPSYPDAHFFRGMVLYRDHKDPQSAIPEFEAFLNDKPPPDAVPTVQQVLDAARQEVAGSTTVPATTAAPAPPPG
jgi:hypothetical protein